MAAQANNTAAWSRLCAQENICELIRCSGPHRCKEQDEGALAGLGVLAAAADDRPTGAGRVVVDRLEIVPHEFGHLERLADETPFRQMEMSLAPGDIEFGAGQLSLTLAAPVLPRQRAARLDRARQAAVAARSSRHRPQA